MANQYISFLIRCWHVGGHEQRIKIEHIQSGESARMVTLAEAMAWIGAHCDQASADAPAVVDHPNLREETIPEG